MIKIIAGLANTAGGLGIVMCLAAGLTRVLGESYLLNYEALTVFSGGVGLMVFASLAKLEVLIRQSAG